jgi:hypothetical protein
MPLPWSRPKKEEIVQERGHAGIQFIAGRPSTERLVELAGDQKFQVFKEMSENDATVWAMLFVVDMQMRHLDWYIRPYSTSNIDKSRANFLEENCYDMSHTIPSFVSEVMTMLPYGFDFEEINYKIRTHTTGLDSPSRYNDGRIGWRKFARRPQWTRKSWKWDSHGGVQAFIQEPSWETLAPSGQTEIIIPILKGLLFRTRAEAGNPEGRSALRGAFRAWWMKKRIENLEGVGIERDLAGIPVMYAPRRIFDANATTADQAIRTEMLDIITKVRNDEQAGLLLPAEYDEHGKPLYSFELVASPGGKQFSTSEIIDRWDHRIAMTIMADMLLLGSKKQGSFALGATKDTTFKDAINSWADDISDILNAYAIPRLFALNGYAIDRLPRFEFGDIKNVDVRALGDLMARLFGAGIKVFPDEETEDYVRSVAGMPKRRDGQPVWKQELPAPGQPGETPGNKVGGRVPEKQRTGRGTTVGSQGG